MKRIARACCAISAALAFGLLASASAAVEPSHLSRAAVVEEAGAGWDAPAAVPQEVAARADDLSVTLPHAKARAVAAPDATALAQPEVAWYRFDIPQQLRVTAAPQELVFYLPRWQTVGSVAVYVGDRLTWRSRGSRVWNAFNRPLWVPLAQAPDAGVPDAVWVRMATQPGVGGAVSTAWAGRAEDLRWRYRLRMLLQVDLVSVTAGAFLVIGLFSLAVWCVRRNEPVYALVFAAAVAHAVRSAHYLVGEQPPWLPDAWFGWMTVNALAWGQVFVFAFAFRLHGRRMPRIATAMVTLAVLSSVLTLPLPWLAPHLSTMLPALYMAFGIQTAVIASSGLWASWASRSRAGLALFAFFALNLPVGVHDLLLQNYGIDMEHIYLGPYTSIGVFTIFLVIVWRRYVGAIREVKELNAGLESRLAARERELNASHEQLRILEREQALAAERQRLVQEMHDGIGSSLVSALRMVERGQASSADTALVLQDCIDDLKLAIDSLHVADADLLALLATMRFRLAPRLKAAGVALTWSVRDLPPLPWLDPQRALHVLRILQEVLTNILKHSGADAIDVGTTLAGDQVEVVVRDNGTPFVPGEAATGAGHGLANVRNRAQALGARCLWSAGEGGGEFRLRLPLAGPAPS